MGIPAINQLAYMEQALYGGMSGMNQSCPSYLNGYRGNSQMYNPAMMGAYPAYAQYYNSLNQKTPSFKGAESIYDTQNTQQIMNSQQTAFGANQADIDILADYYAKGLSPSESFGSAAVGGVIFGLINNPRLMIHPYNSIVKGILPAEKMFKGIKEAGSSLNKLWTNPETHRVIRDAYYYAHKLDYAKGSRLGLFKKKLDPQKYTELKTALENALKFTGSESDKLKKITEASQAIRRETNAFTGLIPRGLDKIGLKTPLGKIRKFVSGDQYKPLSEVTSNVLKENTGRLRLDKSIKHSCGLGSSALWMGMELLMGIPKIKTAFDAQNSGDSKYQGAGWKQLGQTLFKGAGSAIGWGIGEGIGSWGGAMLGAKLGTAISPGVGTAIGFVAGLVGGSIGMWMTGKISKGIVGDDIADGIEADKLKTTAQGQAQLLQLTMQQAQNDKNIDIRTLQAMKNVYNTYA